MRRKWPSHHLLAPAQRWSAIGAKRTWPGFMSTRPREEDRIALASALHAELTGVHRSLVENAQHLTNKPLLRVRALLCPILQ
jgi:hypothetical protein